MDITPLIPEGRKIIRSYGEGIFRLSDEESYNHSIIVTTNKVLVWPGAHALNEQSLTTLEAHINTLDGIEILIIGCGKEMSPLTHTFKQRMKEHSIAVDSMDTGAACRTYNVLLAEGRRVATALIAL